MPARRGQPRNPAWQGAWRGWGLDERGTPIHHDDTDRCCLHHAAWRAGRTLRQCPTPTPAEAPRASGALPEPPLLWGFIQNPQHSVTGTRAGPGPREPTQGPPGLVDLGMVTPGVPVCLSPRIHPKKGHSTQMGTLERSPASWTRGEAAAPAQSPFCCRSGEAGSGKGLGSLAHLTGGETGPCLHAAAAAKSLQSCPTLCDPIDGSPPGSPVPGILQARSLERVAISFPSAGKLKVKVKSLSHARLVATPWTAAHQAPLSMGFSRQEYWSGVPLPSPASMLDTEKQGLLMIRQAHGCSSNWRPGMLAAARL